MIRESLVSSVLQAQVILNAEVIFYKEKINLESDLIILFHCIILYFIIIMTFVVDVVHFFTVHQTSVQRSSDERIFLYLDVRTNSKYKVFFNQKKATILMITILKILQLPFHLI